MPSWATFSACCEVAPRAAARHRLRSGSPDHRSSERVRLCPKFKDSGSPYAAGDVVEAEVQGVGTLRNRVVDEVR